VIRPAADQLGVETVETLARHTGPRGEVALRRRTRDHTSVDELIINGAFAMDSAETSTERQLAQFATRSARRRILVGGLGLGYTAAEILSQDVDRVDVVEIEECLVDWARAGLTPTLAAVAADPRVHLYAADILSVLAGLRDAPRGPWDAIVLDVDNGPDFLIHAANDALYTSASLHAAYAQLAPGGTLAIWCQGPAPELLGTLRQISVQALENRFTVSRENRSFAYAIYSLTRPEPAAVAD
jgi:spermidine synthase